ncbi:actin depolymerizing protein [Saitoella complicata NRRL Y-17804]|uniref:Twinfilin n=1 Tax=Saitoella complicata (strain BCRC 22490 / CBS 7301 / JCM 7358 / NBRC 10748 / NRRL Y-17804) TaxID=698492 RepID=A0A0E9NG50_SAICN|nr:actin depolymerizing protein [Saitoella complicata NRRL Y-17804]ODQ53615.1 actin depolymerizing protein [Saitoella complicata NRRL Y-17804]GAO48793.1 hypothetical protein G7K_2962-t1 [Saitoella complicata NRRL Y-17804]
MSAQSGIKVSDNLTQAFTSFTRDSSLGALKVSITNESLEPSGTLPSDSIESLFADVQAWLEDKTPAYIFLRTSDTAFAFLTYVPDTAPVRQKMLYASTRTALLRDLAALDKISTSVFATTRGELSYKAYQSHLAAENADNTHGMSSKERELAQVKQAEAEGAQYGTGARRSNVVSSAGTGMPLSGEALGALDRLRNGRGTLIQLAIDLENETVELASEETIGSADDLKSAIDSTSPRYSFYAWPHTNPTTSQSTTSTIFIYTCPTSSKVKERMIYSSTRNFVVVNAEKEAGLVIVKKIEANELEDVGEKELMGEIYPKAEGEKKAFSRPRAPGRKRV